ncbi:MAG: hypothetical protein U0Q16_10980 [Bryobacteraceae bacterium]
MAAPPPVPPRLDELGDRHFSFYPPIVSIDHNEWTIGESNWSEILVHNVKTGLEVWIPRAYVGEISKIEEPVMIVGLKRELEYKGGSVWPFTRKVLSMPSGPQMPPPVPETEIAKPSTFSNIRLDSGTESGIGKMIGIALLVGVLLTFVGVMVSRQRSTGGTIEYRGILQAELGFTAQSDYHDVVRKLGKPDEERWKPQGGEREYQALVYKKQDLVIVLMGADRKTMNYIGAKDGKWRTIHAVEYTGGGNAQAILRALQPF